MKTQTRYRKRWPCAWLGFSLLLLCANLFASNDERTSPNYSITAETTDLGGRRSGSANYTNDGSIGLINGIAGSASFLAESGYIPQIRDVPAATPTPTPPGLVQISGSLSSCANPVAGPVAGVTLTLTGSASISTLSDASGNYTLPSLPAGGNYVVTPSKSPLPRASAPINTIDIVAIQRHYLNVTSLPPGCRQAAADVNGDSAINTIDVVAIQRFYLDVPTGNANTGQYRFVPASRTYQGINSNQTGQNYDVYILGDVAAPFASRDGNPGPDAFDASSFPRMRALTGAELRLPNLALNPPATGLAVPVEVTNIDPKENLVGFQGDLIFDPTVIAFEDEPVQKAGLTSGNWSVAGNVLAGPNSQATLRVSAYSTDFQPLDGGGTLFELRVRRVKSGPQPVPLLWANPPGDLFFIDANLDIERPEVATPGIIRLLVRPGSN